LIVQSGTNLFMTGAAENIFQLDIIGVVADAGWVPGATG